MTRYANALMLSLNARQTGANIHTTNWANSRPDTSGDKNSYGLTMVSGLNSSKPGPGSAVPVHISKQTTTDTHVDSQVGALVNLGMNQIADDLLKYKLSKASSNFAESEV